ncbi:unnamed protein product [Rhodiola kirilowii]
MLRSNFCLRKEGRQSTVDRHGGFKPPATAEFGSVAKSATIKMCQA